MAESATGLAEAKDRDYKERKRFEAEKRKILNRYSKVKELIEATEREIADLVREYDHPEIASDYEKLGEISTQIDTLRNELDPLKKVVDALAKLW